MSLYLLYSDVLSECDSLAYHFLVCQTQRNDTENVLEELSRYLHGLKIDSDLLHQNIIIVKGVT